MTVCNVLKVHAQRLANGATNMVNQFDLVGPFDFHAGFDLFQNPLRNQIGSI